MLLEVTQSSPAYLLGTAIEKEGNSKDDGAHCSDVGVSKTIETRRETKYQEATLARQAQQLGPVPRVFPI